MLLGDLDGPTARIDRAGRVCALDDSWRTEWAVGAEDRWRVVEDERTVRQTRIDDTPAYESWLRVPGGDVIARVAAANDGVGRCLVFEFENASPAAVVIAVAGRASGALRADAKGVSLDGQCWMRSARPAGGVVATSGDPWPIVTAGPAGDPASAEGENVAAAILVPLPHRQRTSVVVAVDGEAPTRHPSPEEIAAGWRSVTNRATYLELPDVELAEAWRRVVCDLVLTAGSGDVVAAGEAAWWLDVAGMHGEADRARAVVVEAAMDLALSPAEAVVALRALASRERHAGEASGIDQLAGELVGIASDELDRRTLELTADALRSRDPRAAADAERLAERARSDDRVPESPVAAAAETILARIVRAADPGALELLPEVPAAWRGQPVDVRNLVTPGGSISFSVRWHGDRPAVLWERTGGGDEPVAISFPGLDREWSSVEASGEALLAAPLDS